MHAYEMRATVKRFVCEVPRTRIRLALNSHSNSLPRSIPDASLPLSGFFPVDGPKPTGVQESSLEMESETYHSLPASDAEERG
jgi:hypothetical protein